MWLRLCHPTLEGGRRAVSRGWRRRGGRRSCAPPPPCTPAGHPAPPLPATARRVGVEGGASRTCASTSTNAAPRQTYTAPQQVQTRTTTWCTTVGVKTRKPTPPQRQNERLLLTMPPGSPQRTPKQTCSGRRGGGALLCSLSQGAVPPLPRTLPPPPRPSSQPTCT